MSETLSAAAKRIGVHERTLRRWIKDGCDINNPESVAEFEAIKAKYAPKKFLKDAAPFISANPGDPDEIPDVLPPPDEQGAAAALKRLQEVEPMMFARLLAATKLNRAGLIDAARDNWLKVSDALRKYEEAVELSKRDSHEQIPKSEATDALRSACDWMRLALKSWISSESPNLVALDDPRVFDTLAQVGIKRAMADAFQMSQDAKVPIAEWALETLNEAWGCSQT